MTSVKRWLAKWKPWVRSAIKPVFRSRAELFHARRAFLRHAGRGAAAIAFASLASCFTLRKPLPRPEDDPVVRRVNELIKRNVIVTALREGKSVKAALEGQPDAAILESSLAKFRAGEVVLTTIERERNTVLGVPLPSNVRSRIHSHTVDYEVPAPLRLLLSSIPSFKDVNLFVNRGWDPNSDLRFSHVGVINGSSQLMGYYSLMLTRKARRMIAEPVVEDRTPESKHFFQKLELLGVLADRLDFAEGYDKAETIIRVMGETMLQLKSAGLGIRITPMPGFVFKDGYFQPKP